MIHDWMGRTGMIVFLILDILLLIGLIFLFIYNEHFKVWKNDYYRDRDLIMRKEKLIYKFYRMFI